ncbi:MAG: hypothetical protein EBX41_00465 [Chitinophagia bacterium]|nr:hypothetical protein [Chitinophagia bacterium]
MKKTKITAQIMRLMIAPRKPALMVSVKEVPFSEMNDPIIKDTTNKLRRTPNNKQIISLKNSIE